MKLPTYAIGLVIGLVGLHACDRYDRGHNYDRVQARVLTVDDLCYMEKKDGRTTSTSDTLNCAIANVLVTNHPKWQTYDVKHKIAVAFAYTSPVDGQTHQGKRSYDSYPNTRTPFKAGDTIDVLASKRDANQTRDL